MNKLKSIFKKDKDDELSTGHSHTSSGSTSAQRQSYEAPSSQSQSYGSAPSSRSQANTSQSQAYGSTPQSQSQGYGSTPQSQSQGYGSTPQSQSQSQAYGSTPQSQSMNQGQSLGNTTSQDPSYGNTSSRGGNSYGNTSSGGAVAPTGSSFPAASAPSTGREYAENPQGVVMHTSIGDITIALFAGQTPRTCKNFATLAATGKYDNVVFHRIIPGFMIQGGDPDGTGRGGVSIYGAKFEDEFDSSLRHTDKGTLSMANSGPNTNGSQFFITLGPTPHLDGKHTVFGLVADGMDVVDRLGAVKTGAQDRPIQEVKILRCDVF